MEYQLSSMIQSGDIQFLQSNLKTFWEIVKSFKSDDPTDPYHSIDCVYLQQILMSFNRQCLSAADPYVIQ